MKIKASWSRTLLPTLFMAFVLLTSGDKPANIVEINNANFKSISARRGYVIMDFWATWCPPCRKLGPELEKLAADMGNKLTVGKINVDKNRSLAQQFEVRSIPTMLIYKDGKAVKRLVGYRSKEQIKALLQEIK